ncbi:MAG: AI-2E family transporter [Chloroflexota bacterium]|nr:AI-2E family transporter [Chloroflexota bacterium]
MTIAPPPSRPSPTPIPISPRGRTILIIAGILAVVFLINAAPIVPRLLILGAALALILSFPVQLLERVMTRRLAILLTVLGLLLLIVIALLVFIPVLVFQLTELIANSPQYLDQLQDVSMRALQWPRDRGFSTAEPAEVIQQTRDQILAQAQGMAQDVLANILDAVTQTVSALIGIFGVIFVAVYMLADVGRFRAGFIKLTPRRYQGDAAALWQMLSTSLSRYIGGILISITVQGAAAMIALLVIDVRYAVLWGLWTAMTAVLPYIGAYLGAVPAVIFAFFDSPLKALVTVGIYIAINQLEGNFLTPRIQGEAVRVHPMLIFLAVLAGSEIGGLLGAVIAVPTLAVLRVLVEFFAHRLYVPADRDTRPEGRAGEPADEAGNGLEVPVRSESRVASHPTA